MYLKKRPHNIDLILKLRKQRFKIKALFSDIDGVLTSGGMFYTEKGDEFKRFCVYDGMGMKLLQKYGVKVALITSEDKVLNKNRAEKLKLDGIVQGIWHKKEAAESFCKEWGISLQETAFIGDEINDLELLRNVGMPFCPANANSSVKKIPNIYQLSSAGGEGVVREVHDLVKKYYFI